MPTVREELARGAARLAEAGCDSPRLDAELLLGAALGVPRAQLVMDAREAVSREDLVAYETLLARRQAREPVAYILGRREFRRLSVDVDPRVLIPRPESELLVEVALRLPDGASVADVGTGSGAVALAIKDERPDLEVTGIDVSADALGVAEANGRRLGLDVRWLRGDLLDGISVDAVVANLPYVAEDFLLEPEIADYEPRAAVYGGPDGLAVVRRLLDQLARRPETLTVALEIGFDQADAVAPLLQRAGFGEVSTVKDLAGHPRVVVGRR